MRTAFSVLFLPMGIIAAMVLLSLPAAALVCGGSHCWFIASDPAARYTGNEEVPSAQMQIEFTPAHKVATGLARETYIVPRGAKMSITNISSFTLNCIDGARTTRVIPVRVIEIKQGQAQEDVKLAACKYTKNCPAGEKVRVLCNGNDPRLLCRDIGTGRNHGVTLVEPNGCFAWEATNPSNNGEEACELTCAANLAQPSQGSPNPANLLDLSDCSAVSQGQLGEGEIETAGNYSSTYSVACRCDGTGNVVEGKTDNFDAFTFSSSGKYTFRVEYATTITASKWTSFREFDVIVGPGALEVTAPKTVTVGVKKSVYEQQEYAEKSLRWEVKNISDLDVKLLGVTDLECDRISDLRNNCLFPDFREGIVVKAKESYSLLETFRAYAPEKSPSRKRVSINVLFTDVFESIIADTATGEKPVDQKISFRVQASAITPFKKTGSFEPELGKEYHVQVCTDSPGFRLYNQPLFAMTVYGPDGFEAANARFHAVKSCSDTSELEHLNSTGGLAKFTAKEFEPGKKPVYKWEIAGIVGIEDPALGDLYNSDFARIGLDFNPEKKLVEWSTATVNESLGPQRIVTSAPTELQSFTVNSFERTKNLGTFSPQISPGQNAGGIGPVIYSLMDITIEDPKKKSSDPGPVQLFSDESTVVYTVASTGGVGVNARTSYIERNPGINPPFTDIDILAVDKEKYFFGLGAGPAGICRDLQGNAFRDAEGKAVALTGQQALPRVKYDWRPASISENECDSANQNYSVCDSTQFSISLLKKLEIIDKLAFEGKPDEANQKTVFTSYLMKDGFSADFQKDFDIYLKNKFFSDELKYLGKWAKYFSDTAKLRFAIKNDERVGRLPHDAGVYDVVITPEFKKGAWKFFDEAAEPSAVITVNLIPKGSLAPDLLYHLPIDSTLGLETGKGTHRDGYGVGFSGQSIPIFFDPQGKDSVLSGPPITPDSKPIGKIEVEYFTSFAQTNKDSAGQLLIVTPKESLGIPEYSLKFAPSTPVPAIIRAEEKGGIASASYSVLNEQQGSLDAGNYLSRLVEISFKPGSGQAECTDPATGLKLPGLLGTDKRPRDNPTNVWCELHSSVSNPSTVYGFGRALKAGEKAGDVYLETVFYPPSSSETLLRNACSNQGSIYLATLGPTGTVSAYASVSGGQSVSFSRPQERVQSLADAIRTIGDSRGCIAYGTAQVGNAKVPHNIGVWWNESKFLSDFRSKLVAAPASLPVNACFPGGKK